MEVDYNMLVQNHVHYKYVVWENHLMGGGVIVKDLTPQCGGEEFKSPHFQPRLPCLFRWHNEVEGL
jgi:hypothetical protein